MLRIEQVFTKRFRLDVVAGTLVGIGIFQYLLTGGRMLSEVQRIPKKRSTNKYLK